MDSAPQESQLIVMKSWEYTVAVEGRDTSAQDRGDSDGNGVPDRRGTLVALLKRISIVPYS